MAEIRRDLTRTTIVVMLISSMGLATIWVMRPFIAAIFWAATLVIASWPLMLKVQRRLWGRRSLAVIVMILALILAVVIPFWLVLNTLIANGGKAIAFAQFVVAFKLPPVPGWLHAVPFAGAHAAQIWASAANRTLAELSPDLTAYAGQAARLLVAAIGGAGTVFVQFLLTLIIAGVLYARGEDAGTFAQHAARRLAGARGEDTLRLLVHAIRGVALGIVVSALIESAIGGAGLAVAGLPFAALLTAVIFAACVLQIGPGIVLIPATLWMFWRDDPRWAIFLLAVTVVVIVLENSLRPMLMRKQAQLPLLLILAGVLGGIAAFGLVGIFLGPTVLAVTYTLLQAWVAEDSAPQDVTAAVAPPDAGPAQFTASASAPVAAAPVSTSRRVTST